MSDGNGSDPTARISAVIVNYNASGHLVECVRSLHADGVTDVAVVDNGSTDGLEGSVARLDPRPTVLRTGGNLGFGAAANRGAAVTAGELLAIMNPDTVVEPGTMKALGEAFDRDISLAIAGTRVEYIDGSLYPSARTFPNLRDAAGHAFLGFVNRDNRFSRRYKMLDQEHDGPHAVDWVSGTCLLVRRSVFEQLGGFDEGYFMYVEDVDLCWRCWQAGGCVGYEPAGRVVHAIGVSSEQAPYRMILAHHRSLWRFSLRTTNGGRRLVLPLVALALAGRTLLAWLQRAARRRPHAAP